MVNVWCETLLNAIDVLPNDAIDNQELLSIALCKAQLGQTDASRLFSCKMLGKLCSRVDQSIVKQDILPVVQSLCQDLDCDIRTAICYQLGLVSRVIGYVILLLLVI